MAERIAFAFKHLHQTLRIDEVLGTPHRNYIYMAESEHFRISLSQTTSAQIRAD